MLTADELEYLKARLRQVIADNDERARQRAAGRPRLTFAEAVAHQRRRAQGG